MDKVQEPCIAIHVEIIVGTKNAFKHELLMHLRLFILSWLKSKVESRQLRPDVEIHGAQLKHSRLTQ